MVEQTYGRGQVEWALWSTFTGKFNPPLMPKIFATRIKKLLELDRNLDLSKMEAPPDCEFAFAPLPVDGTEIAYKPIDAFCLAIALDLLDAGYKQSEVVFIMQYLRRPLEKQMPQIHNEPSLLDRQRNRAEDYPGYPTTFSRNLEIADARVFLIIRKIEMVEIIPETDTKVSKHPTFLEPKFCRGVDGLTNKIDKMLPSSRRTATIIEIARTAQAVRASLDKAPVIRRGRPKNS